MWSEDMLEKIKNNLSDVVEDQDDDDVQTAIAGAFDLKELVREVAQDDEVKNALKAKVKSLILEKIEEADSLDDNFFGDDDFNLGECLSILEVVKEIIITDHEEIKERVKNLILKEIDNADDLDDLYNDGDFNIGEHLPLEEMVKEIVESNAGKKILEEKIKELIEEYVSDMGCDDLPNNMAELLNVSDEIIKLNFNSDFKKKLSDKLWKIIAEDNTLLYGVLKNLQDDPAVIGFVKIQVADLLRDAAFRTSLAERVKCLFLDDKKGGEMLLTALSGSVAMALAEKIIGR